MPASQSKETKEKPMERSAAEHPVIGIDLGGTKILASTIDATGKILSRFKKRTKAEKPFQEVVQRIANCARGAAQEAGIPLADIAGVGIGAPGAMNPIAGIIHFAPNLNWKEVPLKKLLEDDLGVPVFLENDVNLGTLGEQRFGAGVGMKNIFGMFVGTGIGGGIIIDGKLYEGASFMAGEVGHIPMVLDGPLCGCGRWGCFEAIAGRLAVVRDIANAVKQGEKTSLLMEKSDDILSIKSNAIAKAWQEGDALTVKVLKNAAFYIGRGVASIIAIFNPDAVILGGGLIEALDNSFFQQIIKSADVHSIPAMFKETKILRALLGDDAGIIGAAFHSWDCLANGNSAQKNN